MLTNSSWTNGRQKFRLWRRTRPFWGGLLLLLSGIELFASANMDLTTIQFHIGPEGFLSYLLPVLLLVCGLLVWLTPNQRIFYAIIGSLTAVYALIGLNLGGFLLGTLIGMIGGGLAFAWAPDGAETAPVLPAAIPAWARRRTPRRTESTQDEADADEDEYEESGAVTDRHLDEPATPQTARHRSPLAVTIGVPLLITATLAGTLSASPGRAVAAPTTCPPNPAQLAGGKPQAAVPPVVAGQPAAAPPAAAPPAAPPAAAPPAAPTTTSAPPPAAVPTTTAPAATPPTNPDGPMTRPPTYLEILYAIQHNIINAWIEFWAKVFGIPLPPKPTPTPTPTAKPPPPPPPPPTTTQPAPTTTPPTTTAPAGGSGGGGQAPPGGPATTTKGGAPAPGTCPPTSGAAGAPPAAAPQAAAPAGQPNVSDTPATLTAATQILNGFSFVGVVSLPTAGGGSIRVLQFSATRATSVDFALTTASGGRHSVSINSNPLVVSGTVSLFASRFQGTLLGIPLTFTPDIPPPLTLPDMTFTNVTIELVFLDTTSLQAPTLAQTSN